MATKIFIAHFESTDQYNNKYGNNSLSNSLSANHYAADYQTLCVKTACMRKTNHGFWTFTVHVNLNDFEVGDFFSKYSGVMNLPVYPAFVKYLCRRIQSLPFLLCCSRVLATGFYALQFTLALIVRQPREKAAAHASILPVTSIQKHF